jgi:hypothetical protein
LTIKFARSTAVSPSCQPSAFSYPRNLLAPTNSMAPSCSSHANTRSQSFRLCNPLPRTPAGLRHS